MNIWTEKSIKFANSAGYLDKLGAIYPVQINPEREIPHEAIPTIQKLHNTKDATGLVQKLMELKKFPIDDPYIRCLRFSGVFSKNPKTVERIGTRLIELDFDTLITLCQQPKSGTRQLGHMFKHWVKTKLGFPVLEESEFDASRGICVLDGSDAHLEEYVNSHLEGGLTKGIDLVLKVKPNRYILGEAKFITAHGGTQTNQLDVALELTEKHIKNALPIAIVDGAVWFESSYKNKIIQKDKPVMSALLLQEFINSQS